MPSHRVPTGCWRGKLPHTRCATCAQRHNCVDYPDRGRIRPFHSTRRHSTVSATAGQADGVRSPADRFGIEPDMVVMEMGYDDDVDEDLRDALAERCGELVDEDTDEVVDAVLLWYRDGDGDLFDLLTNALGPLADTGVVWLLTPKAGREGHVEPSEVSESAPTAGLQQTSTVNAGKDWTAARLVSPRGAAKKK